MHDVDALYAEFVRAWNAGEAPELDAFLDRADPAIQDELIDRITTFALVARSVEPAPERAAALRTDPAFERAMALEAAGVERSWGARLRAARERAGLTLAQLGERFAASFPEAAGRGDKAAIVLGRLETEHSPATGVTRRAADRLADLLDIAGEALAPPPRPQALFRRGTAGSDGAAGAGPARRLDPGVEVPPSGEEHEAAPAASPSPAELAAFAFSMDPAADPDDWDAVDDLLRGGELLGDGG